jgi:hypothetical protein
MFSFLNLAGGVVPQAEGNSLHPIQAAEHEYRAALGRRLNGLASDV